MQSDLIRSGCRRGAAGRKSRHCRIEERGERWRGGEVEEARLGRKRGMPSTNGYTFLSETVPGGEGVAPPCETRRKLVLSPDNLSKLRPARVPELPEQTRGDTVVEGPVSKRRPIPRNFLGPGSSSTVAPAATTHSTIV